MMCLVKAGMRLQLNPVWIVRAHLFWNFLLPELVLGLTLVVPLSRLAAP